MKSTIINLSLFVLLVLVFSGLTTSCEKTADSSKGSPDENTKTANPETKDPKKSDYPMAPEAILKTELKAIDGTTFKIEDKKGKVVLINLWATWCGPCRSEMPHLIEMQNKYRDQGFEVIGLDTDENETVEQIKEFAADMKLNYTLGMSDDKFTREFFRLTGQPAIPQSMLINREGRMTGLFTGAGQDLMVKLKKIVEQTVSE